ncbi:hypothetical protein [Swaminathania salitolerans]|uniref:Uncharacterized protein n=1 Tax=Swaminathania salitolerans TaxID=182838 RepID=A0A511BP59_9PROT|nr:hypothetical protein [Swaminathania salitolerans]GBQ14707.1 hypothetical protein AA21291_1931 [Swaminathania salitolerans LMG 21291]GEL01862.1 hypothetical protein SSA02_10250 [Swaminathania salitolerans]
MTWRPSANILRPRSGAADPASCPGGGRTGLAWPSSALGGGGDYSVDFDGLLAPGEYVTAFAFSAGDVADQGWTSLFGTIATAWLRWTSAGTHSIAVCALTDRGNSYQIEAGITVSSRSALFPVPLPAAPPSGGTAPPGTGSGPDAPAIALTGAIMDAWMRSLPTDPAEAPDGWCNNAGIPTRLGEIS